MALINSHLLSPIRRPVIPVSSVQPAVNKVVYVQAWKTKSSLPSGVSTIPTYSGLITCSVSGNFCHEQMFRQLRRRCGSNQSINACVDAWRRSRLNAIEQIVCMDSGPASGDTYLTISDSLFRQFSHPETWVQKVG